MNTDGVELLNNANATGEGKQWNGGRGFFVAVATFGGGTVAAEFLGPDSTTWLPVPALAGGPVSVTAAGGLLFELPPCTIRATVVTATAVYARADRIPS